MIAAQLAERRRRAAAAEEEANEQSANAPSGLDFDSVESFSARREAELSARKAYRSKIEQAARRESEALLAKRANQEPPELLAAKEALAVGLAARRGSTPGSCPICNQELQEKHMKRLPCGHAFHFACINAFFKSKMEKDKDMSLPCFTCNAPSNRSIDSVAEEIKRKREAQREAEAAALREEAERQAELDKVKAQLEKADLDKRQGPSLEEMRSAAAKRTAGAQRRGGALAALARATQEAQGEGK